MFETEMNFRIGERQPVKDIANMAELRSERFQKFSPGRHIVKKISELDGSSCCSGSHLAGGFVSAINAQSVC
jgi:hypothetical protein